MSVHDQPWKWHTTDLSAKDVFRVPQHGDLTQSFLGSASRGEPPPGEES